MFLRQPFSPLIWQVTALARTRQHRQPTSQQYFFNSRSLWHCKASSHNLFSPSLYFRSQAQHIKQQLHQLNLLKAALAMFLYP